MLTTQVHPELGRFAAKLDLVVPFFVWSILRQVAIDENLSSHYHKNDAKSILKKFGLGYSPIHLNRILKKGEGLFWSQFEGTIFLRSFEKVAKKLIAKLGDQDKIYHAANLMASCRVHKSLEKMNAELYWAWFLQSDEKTISRATLQDLFGFSPQAQRSYEKILGSRLIVRSNYAQIDAENYKQDPEPLPEYQFSITYEREIRFDEDTETVIAIQYQLPNSFLARMGSDDLAVLDLASNRVKRVARTLLRQTDGLRPNIASYWLKWSSFERNGKLEDYVRCFIRCNKALWLIGKYL